MTSKLPQQALSKAEALKAAGVHAVVGQAQPQMQTAGGTPQTASAAAATFPSKLYQHVLDLTNPEKREAALLELSKKREEFPDLAPILWHSFGTISALLQEIVSIYPLLSPPRLTPAISNRCCNALALLQCVASHSETRSLFLNCTPHGVVVLLAV